MNKKAQNIDIGKLFEAIIAIIFLAVFVPIIIGTLFSISHPSPQIVINNTAVDEARNLSERLAICENNYNELNKSVVTKQDLLDLTSAIKDTNKNVISIYESNQNFISNYFSFTVVLSITLGIVFSIGLFTLLDLTVFKMEFVKSFIKVIKHRFTKVEVNHNN